MIITCNVGKLHDEFVTQNIKPFPVFDNGDGTGDFTFPEETDMTAVQAVIDAHDPTPLPPVAGQDEFNLDVDFRLTMIELGVF